MENKVFLHRYRLSLGRNGLPVELHRTPSGITYRGHAIDSGREVAIELIPWSSADPAANAQMEQIAAAAKQMNHVNIPTLLDFGIEDQQLVCVTDHFEGCTAEAWVAARGPLPLGSVLRVALQVAGALGAASFHRLQHSAINPANIIFLPGQTAEGDWPAIKILHWLGPNDAFAERSNARADAAARFASPEQLQGGGVDFASAIFSLGCTMWFLLTGTPPAVPGAKGVRAAVSRLRGVPKIVRHLLGRMLRVNPAERPQDPVVLQAYLQTCLARVERREALSRRFGIPLFARPTATAAAAPAPARRWPLKALALAALLLLGFAALALPRLLRPPKSAHAKAAVEKAVGPAPTAVAMSRTPGAPRPTLPNEIVTEPAPPAEGPVQIAAAATPLPSAEETVASAAQTESPPALVRQEPAIATAPVNVASVAEKELPSVTPNDLAKPAIEPENSATPQPVVAGASPPPLATPSPAAEEVEIARESSSRKKSAKRSVASASKSHHQRRRGLAAQAEVRRARQIPTLHVGSRRAELVGTTDDGRWILSVDASGERVIVPPPPGFGR